MPTAIPAASVWPTATKKQSFNKIIAFALALPLAATIVMAAEPPGVAASASPACSSHASLSRPPTTIRVLRGKTGRIDTINFREYVVTVMGKEWPSYLPQAVVEAGAIAVKQYAWYHMVYTSRRSNGRCFDVKDGTGDQLYRPDRARVRPDHYRALNATWNVTLRKDGRFFMTGYRRGERVACGRDATGYKLFARSATMCARKSWGWRQIVREYYGPRLSIVGDGGSSSAASSVSADALTVSRATNTAVRRSDGTWVDPALTQAEAMLERYYALAARWLPVVR